MWISGGCLLIDHSTCLYLPPSTGGNVTSELVPSDCGLTVCLAASFTEPWVGHKVYHHLLFLTKPSGFPLDFFPVLFAVPRVVGWLAHWRQVLLLY